jgi:hypothetical protein
MVQDVTDINDYCVVQSVLQYLINILHRVFLRTFQPFNCPSTSPFSLHSHQNIAKMGPYACPHVTTLEQLNLFS